MVRQCSCCKYDEGSYRKRSGELVEMASNVRCTKCKEMDTKRNPRRKEIFRSKYPVPSNVCVYAFKKGDEVIYIGSSEETAKRINRHYNDSEYIFCPDINPLIRQRDFTWHILWHGDDYNDAKHMEKLNIQTFQPKFNKIKYKTYEG